MNHTNKLGHSWQALTSADEFRGLFKRISKMKGSENAEKAVLAIPRIRDAECVHDCLALSPNAFMQVYEYNTTPNSYLERARVSALYCQLHESINTFRMSPWRLFDILTNGFFDDLARMSDADAKSLCEFCSNDHAAATPSTVGTVQCSMPAYFRFFHFAVLVIHSDVVEPVHGFDDIILR